MVLTGVYSEETHKPQPLRISVTVEIDVNSKFTPETPMGGSKSYMDLKHAVTSLPQGIHFTLVESVAEQIAQALLATDHRVSWVEVRIIKLALSEKDEAIGVTLTRRRP